MAESVDDVCLYSGDNANREWRDVSGCDSEVPVVKEDGICLDWDESCLESEVMSSVIEENGNIKFSRITLGALEDLGYMVDYFQADDFTAADLGTGCACSRRLGQSIAEHRQEVSQSRSLIGDETIPQRRQLRPSVEAEKHAKEVGKEHLRQMQLRKTSQTESPIVSVFFEEGGKIFAVVVSGNDAESGTTRTTGFQGGGKSTGQQEVFQNGDKEPYE